MATKQKSIQFRTGQRLETVRGTDIVSKGERGTVIDLKPGLLPGHMDVRVHFDKDRASGIGPMTLDASAWGKYFVEVPNA